MEFREMKSYIDELMDRLERSSIGKLELEVPGLRICLEKAGQPSAVTQAAGTPAAAVTAVPAASTEKPAEPPSIAAGNVMKSPMVGTFYAAPSPDVSPFVKVGDRVKKGDTLCIIEAMKMMNEIESEYDGTVASVLAANGSLIEYGQPLIVIT